MNSGGMLFIMSGPSGTGKGTICKQLEEYEDIYLSVSSTTREVRKDEIPGVTYNYVSINEFEKMIENGEMLEYAKYGQNYYGTPKREVTDNLKAGKNVILEIEAQGADIVKEKMPEAVRLFVVPPSVEELRKRLSERGRETDEEIKQRLETAKWEFTRAAFYDKIFVNDELPNCINEVREYISQKNRERELLNELIKEIK